jgi:hypothetical protein
MPKATNPLLIAMRAANMEMNCIRVFTSVHKTGLCRVKMYGTFRQIPDLYYKLTGAFTQISEHFDSAASRIHSVTIYAMPNKV